MLLGRKAMTNLDSRLKNRDITLPTNVHLVKAMVFLVVMYGYESWTIKKGESQRIDAFKLWWWRRLESPLDCKEIKLVNPKGPWIFIGMIDAEAEAPILGPHDVKNRLIGKDSDAGKDWGQKEKGWQSRRWLGDIINSMDVSLSKLWEIVEDREAWHSAIHGVTKSWTQLSGWTTTIKLQMSLDRPEHFSLYPTIIN